MGRTDPANTGRLNYRECWRLCVEQKTGSSLLRWLSRMLAEVRSLSSERLQRERRDTGTHEYSGVYMKCVEASVG